MNIPISNSNSNLTPDYSKEMTQVQTRKGGIEGSKGAILVKDSLEVPFEKQISFQANQAEAGQPFLPPMFRMRLAVDPQL